RKLYSVGEVQRAARRACDLPLRGQQNSCQIYNGSYRILFSGDHIGSPLHSMTFLPRYVRRRNSPAGSPHARRARSASPRAEDEPGYARGTGWDGRAGSPMARATGWPVSRSMNSSGVGAEAASSQPEATVVSWPVASNTRRSTFPVARMRERLESRAESLSI